VRYPDQAENVRRELSVMLLHESPVAKLWASVPSLVAHPPMRSDLVVMDGHHPEHLLMKERLRTKNQEPRTWHRTRNVYHQPRDTSHCNIHVDFPAACTLRGVIYLVMIEGIDFYAFGKHHEPFVAGLTVLIAQPSE
jgi:hypothetical protein